MLLVVTHEVIPESRRNGHDKLASLGCDRVLSDDGDGYGVGLNMIAACGSCIGMHSL
jgi:hypothetical protein